MQYVSLQVGRVDTCVSNLTWQASIILCVIVCVCVCVCVGGGGGGGGCNMTGKYHFVCDCVCVCVGGGGGGGCYSLNDFCGII